jgi:hypothetical protein
MKKKGNELLYTFYLFTLHLFLSKWQDNYYLEFDGKWDLFRRNG